MKKRNFKSTKFNINNASYSSLRHSRRNSYKPSLSELQEHAHRLQLAFFYDDYQSLKYIKGIDDSCMKDEKSIFDEQQITPERQLRVEKLRKYLLNYLNRVAVKSGDYSAVYQAHILAGFISSSFLYSALDKLNNMDLVINLYVDGTTPVFLTSTNKKNDRYLNAFKYAEVDVILQCRHGVTINCGSNSISKPFLSKMSFTTLKPYNQKDWKLLRNKMRSAPKDIVVGDLRFYGSTLLKFNEEKILKCRYKFLLFAILLLLQSSDDFIINSNLIKMLWIK